jgi:hypothetical protein
MNGNALIVRHSYKVERSKKQYDVYQLTGAILVTSNQPIEPIFPEFARVELFRNYSLGSGFDHYFRIKTTTNWATSEQVTGMFKTNNPLIYYGDRKHQGRNLLIFIFNDDRTQLTVDYYLEYCPYNRTNQITPELQAILSKYK